MTEACDLCGDQGELQLRARCHLTAPLQLSLDGDELVARCYLPTCRREVARFRLAEVVRRSAVDIALDALKGELCEGDVVMHAVGGGRGTITAVRRSEGTADVTWDLPAYPYPARCEHALSILVRLEQRSPDTGRDTTMQTEPIMQFFEYEHLPPHLQAVSKPFCELAKSIVASVDAPFGLSVPRNAERTVALRKLLEAKDAAVRAVLFKAEA